MVDIANHFCEAYLCSPPSCVIVLGGQGSKKTRNGSCIDSLVLIVMSWLCWFSLISIIDWHTDRKTDIPTNVWTQRPTEN